MDELETKVAEALYTTWASAGVRLRWDELTDGLRAMPIAQARSAIAVMRAHGGCCDYSAGYEAGVLAAYDYCGNETMRDALLNQREGV